MALLLPLLLLGASADLARAASGGQCGASNSTCPQEADCCPSQYSPSTFGCLVASGEVANASIGCGDGLSTDASGNVCCKMGPKNPGSTTQPNVLIIGDSVSIGYTSLGSKNVVDLLAPTAAAQHGPWDVSDGGALDTAYGVVCLDRWLMTQSQDPVTWDVITFNFGALFLLLNGCR